MKISFITTVYNEEKNINSFLNSIFEQTKMPDEIIVADGGSNDGTVKNIKSQISKNKTKKVKFKVLIRKGNRSLGRNEAIKCSTGDIILCSDAGNILGKDWIKNIINPFKDQKVDVVAGYYKGKADTIFQKCLVPYVLIMEDKVNYSNFLPSTRSIAFKKSIWEKIGGFDEKFSHNEDYVFAKKLNLHKAKILFAKNAVVSWIPKENIKEAFIMFFRFAFGDGESKIIRGKVIFIFARYLYYLYFLAYFSIVRSPIFFGLTTVFPLIYIVWSIKKNYKYVKDTRAFIILPILQIVSDLAVLIGTSFGFIKSIVKVNYIQIYRKNYLFLIILAIYIIIELFMVRSGIPNQNHPFNYQMDEWHQAQSVRNVFKYGSPNLAGSANGTMFHFFLTGLFITPFFITKIIDPFTIKSSLDFLFDQEKLFILLRLNTLFFGFLALVMLSKVSKLLKLNSFIAELLFVFTPVWLLLSNFFKYDIALTFWIILSFYFLLKYSFFPKKNSFFLACFFSGVAFAVKVSAVVLLPIIILAYFLFTPKFNKNYIRLVFGLFLFVINCIFLGLPDIFFGGRNMNEYLYENIIGSSKILGNYILGDSLFNLTVLHKLPIIFGHGLYALSFLALSYLVIITFVDFKKKKYHEFKRKLFILLSFSLFSLSLIPFGITISANRSVVLLPFVVIIIGIAIKNFRILLNNKYVRYFLIAFFTFFIVVQIFESYLWVKLKITPSPQEISSIWIEKNISQNSNIGLENIPIYQFEPDLILKEFYSKKYYPSIKTKYKYFVINKNTKVLPEYIIISNVKYEHKFLRKSLKNDLVEKIYGEKYKQIIYFSLEIPLYKYFDNYFYYPYTGLLAYPDGISIFRKI